MEKEKIDFFNWLVSVNIKFLIVHSQFNLFLQDHLFRHLTQGWGLTLNL